VAITTIAELGDVSRFDNPRQLMAYLGLTPSEYTSGESRRQGASQKPARAMPAGQSSKVHGPTASLRRSLPSFAAAGTSPEGHSGYFVEGSSNALQTLPQLVARGKNPNVAVTAVARELAAFIWAISREVRLAA